MRLVQITNQKEKKLSKKIKTWLNLTDMVTHMLRNGHAGSSLTLVYDK